jgi:Queuine/archaeosine tRNA-ribosyltransferase
MNAAILVSHHNVAFFMNTMRQARDAITGGRFQQFHRDFLDKLTHNDAAGV